MGSTPAPKRLGYLNAVGRLEYTRSLDGNESLQARIPSVDFPSWIRSTHILRVSVIGDLTVSGAFEEYRISRAIRAGTVVQIEARGLMDDLSLCGAVYQQDTNGRLYEFTDTKTVADWLTFLKDFHQLRGFTYWAPASGAPTDSVTLALSRHSPRQILEMLAKGEAGIGLWEYRLEYNTVTGMYDLHFAEEYNATADPLRVIGGHNLLSIEDEERTEDFMSGIAPSGKLGEDVAARSIAGSLWKVGTVTGSPAKIVLLDPNGDANVKAIAMDDQFNGTGYTCQAQCLRTGRRYSITDTVSGTQEIYLDAVDQLVAGDFVELFYVPSGTTLQRHYYRTNSVAVNSGRKVCAMQVGTITGASLRFQALDPGTGAVGSLIYGRNTGMTGLQMRRSTTVLTSAISAFNSGTSRITVASTTGVVAGDWGNCYTASGWVYETFRVVSVVSGTVLEIAQKYRFMEGVAFTIPASPTLTSVRILREQSDVYYVTKHTGYQNYNTDPQQNIWLDNVTNLSTGDYVEAFLETGGIPVDELYSPTALAGYPNVLTDPERRARPVYFSRYGGNPQMVPQLEPHFDSVTDGWGGNTFNSGTVTTSTFGKNGANMFQSNTAAATLDCGRASTTDDAKANRLIRLLRDPFSGSGRLVIQALVKMFSVTPPWTFQIGIVGYQDIANTFLSSTTYNDTSNPGAVDPDTFLATHVVDPTITGAGGQVLRIGGCLPLGVVLGFYATNAAYRIDGYRVYWAPDGGTNPSDTINERGAGPRLWSRSNEYLLLYDTPPRSLKCAIADLWRMDRTRYSGMRVLLGGPVSVYNEQTSTDLGARITSVRTIFSPELSSQIGIDVNTQQQTLSQRLVEGG